jgi:hypothetical protein
VRHPKELAYFNHVTIAGTVPRNTGAFAVSAPAYDPASHDVWYTDSNAGLYVVRLVGGAGVSFAPRFVSPGS